MDPLSENFLQEHQRVVEKFRQKASEDILAACDQFQSYCNQYPSD